MLRNPDFQLISLKTKPRSEPSPRKRYVKSDLMADYQNLPASISHHPRVSKVLNEQEFPPKQKVFYTRFDPQISI